jgi:hypothetical protein
MKVKSEESPIKKFKSAYILFTADRRPLIQNQNPNLTNSREITKLIALEWKSLPDEQKAVYKEKEKAEREKFNSQKENEKINQYKYKKYKKLKKPVRYRTPYMLFVKAQKESFKGISSSTNMSNLSRQWHSMTEEEKKPYVILSQEDKKRYQLELDGYVKTFFHMKPSKREKLFNNSDNQLIELFKKSYEQNKPNKSFNENIKSILKSRHLKSIKLGRADKAFDFEINKHRKKSFVEQNNLTGQNEEDVPAEESNSESEIEFDCDVEDLFGENVKYGSEALMEFRKMNKRDPGVLTESERYSSDEYSN